MSLEESGFLADEMDDVVRSIRSDYAEVFTLADQVNRFCMERMWQIQPHDQELQELLAAAFFARALSSFQGSLLMLERGMVPQAKALVRTMLEIAFFLKAIELDPPLAERYGKEHNINRLKFYRKFEKLDQIGQLPEQLTREELKAALDEVKGEIEASGVRNKWTTEDWAKRAGMEHEYLTIYTMLSIDVHGYPTSIDRHFVTGQNGNIEQLHFGPEIDGIDTYGLLAVELILLCLKMAESIHEIEPGAGEGSIGEQLDKVRNTLYKSDQSPGQ